ncbi:SAP domain containing protein [Euroglyphus maynei]|uniref:SAP domain containing protein n=1 Tax=Euroglyphus maynei TaxID=6958 RepID=A0A1Y3AS26_EURMA|nr:SAP domain containing protein [Euroglyphus maynei]
MNDEIFLEEPAITKEPEPIRNVIEQPEKLNDSVVDDESNSKSVDSSAKFASISINEEKETIKLTIRSSPRKQEPVQQQDSESEESQSGDATDPDSDQKDENDVVNTSQNEIPSAEPESKMDSDTDNTETKTDQSSQENESKNSHENQQTKLEEPKIDECKIKKQSTPKIEQKIEECPKNEIKIKSNDSKNRTLIIKNRMTTQKSTEETVQKKRRWGSSQTNESSVLKKGISSDELKQLINDSIIDNDEPAIKVSKSNEEKTLFNNKTDESPPQQKPTEIIETEIKKVDISFKNEVVEMSQVEIEQKENGNIEENGQRSLSPAKNPESTVLFITGLVRPYTLMQLKKLLNSNGQIDEEKFWIDKIKSKCYATYSSVEEAVKTRKNLHNLKWPQSSPKNLCVEFATLEDIDRCLNPENYEDLPRKNVEKNSSTTIAENKGKYDIIMKEPKVETMEKSNDKNETIAAARGNIREWDRDKVTVKISRHEEKEKIDDNQRQLKKPKVESPSDHHHHHHHHHRDKSAKTTGN